MRHAHWRWLKAALALCGVATAIYAWHEPADGANGGTWLGYTLGTVAALIIVLLSWLGVRKRRYASRLGTVKGWVSAHVYLGLSLLVLATLHTGFQFGANLHTLAYALMVLVIASGVYGVVAYARYPRLITDNRAQSTREAWLDEILELNESAIRLADAITPEVHRSVLRSAERLRIGGGWRDQLSSPSQDERAQEMALVGESLRAKLAASSAQSVATEQMVFLATTSLVVTDRDPQLERLKQLLELLTRRNELVDRVNRDVQIHARLQIWLYWHVPLTAALLAALTAHIVSVFLYW
ncbi:MAG TPA: hypothetical protein VM240_02160 [Verrucomicrobiae bacterium]|nr:hypothetical protein [Verrucomicrobiae bacterium]